MTKQIKFKNVDNFMLYSIGYKLIAEIRRNNWSVGIIGNCYEIHEFLQEYNFNCTYIEIDFKNNKYKKEIENMPKFDVVIGNPPFEGQGNPLYLQILEICHKIAHKIIWICPSTWVKSYKDSEYVKNVKNTCKLISHKHIANPFNAGIYNEVGIYEFGEAEVYENYEELFFEKFSNKQLAKSIISKFEKYLQNHDSIKKHNNDTKKNFCVNGAKVRGHYGVWDYTTIFGEKQRTQFIFESKYKNHWYFDTELECKNFVKTHETDLCEFAYFITKKSQDCTDAYFVLIPWFGDYTHEWSEDEISKELGFTQEEVDYIHEEMKNYGWKASPKNKG